MSCEYTRNCPKCGKIITYTNKNNCRNAYNAKTLCFNCAQQIRFNKKIDNFKEYVRYCPICNKKLIYKTRKIFLAAVNNNAKCHSLCDGLQSKINEKIKIENNIYYKHCPICDCKLFYKTLDNCKKAIKANTKCYKCNNSNPNKIKIFKSEEIKAKHRTNIIKRFNSNGSYFIGNNENKWFNKYGLNIKNQYEFFGYMLDGFDEKNNIVWEYDEPRHERKKEKGKDLIRQNNIINYLKPNAFFRFSEKYNKLYCVYFNKNCDILIKNNINNILKEKFNIQLESLLEDNASCNNLKSNPTIPEKKHEANGNNINSNIDNCLIKNIDIINPDHHPVQYEHTSPS